MGRLQNVWICDTHFVFVTLSWISKQTVFASNVMRLPQSTPLHGLLLVSAALSSLSTCRMESPEELYQSNIFIGDLAMHDSNREYILAGSQQSPELSLALSQVGERHCDSHLLHLSAHLSFFSSYSSSSSSSSRSRYAANSWRTVFSRLINSSIRWSQSQLLINCEVERHPSIRVRWVSLMLTRSIVNNVGSH